MSTVLLFEDNENTPSSKLLSKSVNGHNIIFSSGDYLLFSCIQSLKQSGIEEIIVFIDLVPDNVETVVCYEELVSLIKNSGYTGITLFPIVCIEVYIIRMLAEYDYLLHTKNSQLIYDCICSSFEWLKLPDNKRQKSLEKLYKQVLAEQQLFCMQNQNKEKNPVFGSFYKDGCDECKNKVCHKDRLDSIELKANRLYTKLPVFTADENECSKLVEVTAIEECNIEKELKNMQIWYDIMCELMNVECISIITESIQ